MQLFNYKLAYNVYIQVQVTYYKQVSNTTIRILVQQPACNASEA